MKRMVKLMDGESKEIEVREKLNILERNKILSKCTKTTIEGNRTIAETDMFLLQTLTLQKIVKGISIELIDPDDCDSIFEGYKGIFGLTVDDKKKEK